jgi:hypothetical protein
MPTLTGCLFGQSWRRLRSRAPKSRGAHQTSRCWADGAFSTMLSTRAVSLPQPRQRFSARCASRAVGVAEMPLASRLCVWVKCVGDESICTRFRVVNQNCCVTVSAIGATARPQIGAVSDSRAANDPMSRQLPSRCSKNHSRLRGLRVIQSSRYAST